jgi:hypothetical protein
MLEHVITGMKTKVLQWRVELDVGSLQ